VKKGLQRVSLTLWSIHQADKALHFGAYIRLVMLSSFGFKFLGRAGKFLKLLLGKHLIEGNQ